MFFGASKLPIGIQLTSSLPDGQPAALPSDFQNFTLKLSIVFATTTDTCIGNERGV
jgi:hypothetical protein